MKEMRAGLKDCAVLGVDASWAARNPSGVALVSCVGGQLHVDAVASSFASFLEIAQSAPASHAPAFADVIRAAKRLARAPLICIAMDIPLSRKRIVGRRAADRAISTAFGAAKCSAHSPNPTRPGDWGRELQRCAEDAGYALRVAGDPPGLPRTRSLIEVYPHPALLRLTGSIERLEYKSKFPRDVRRQAFRTIAAALGRNVPTVVPADLVPAKGASGREWKAADDALDALVCCWIGFEFLAHRAIPYGDREAAVWVPAATPQP